MKTKLTLLAALGGIAMAASAQTSSFQDVAGGFGLSPQMTIYSAKEIVTLDPANPKANAVAVVGNRILAVGSLDELKKAAGDQPFIVDKTFANQVIVPGFIGQHDHPLLAGLTMIAEIISIEDWVLPSGTVPAAKNHEEYMKRVAEANAALEDPDLADQ